MFTFNFDVNRNDKISTPVSSQGSVAERSKALDLGSSLSGGVGSNPTTAKPLLSQSKAHLMLLSVPNTVLATLFTIIIPLSKCLSRCIFAVFGTL